MGAKGYPKFPGGQSNPQQAPTQATASICMSFVAGAHRQFLEPAVFELPVDPENASRIADAARRAGFRSFNRKIGAAALPRAPLPLIVQMKCGTYNVVVECSSSSVTVFDPTRPKALNTLSTNNFIEVWTGNVVFMSPANGGSKDAKKLTAIFNQSRGIIAQILLASLAIQIFGLAVPLFSQIIIDKVLLHQSTSALHVLGTGMLLLIAFECVMAILRGHALAAVSSKADVAIGSALIDGLLKLPFQFFATKRSGHISGYFREVDALRNILNATSIFTIVDFAFSVLLLGLLCIYSQVLGLVTATCCAAIVLLAAVSRSSVQRSIDKQMLQSADQHNAVIEMSAGIQTIKTLSLQRLQKKKLHPLLINTALAAANHSAQSSSIGAVVNATQRLSHLIILWIGAYQTIDGLLTLGQLIAVQMIASRISHPLVRVVTLISEVHQMRTTLGRLGEVLDAPAEGSGRIGHGATERVVGAIEFRGVDFRYHPKAPLALKEASFTLPSGGFSGIVGRSGSGKSTLARLMQNLYQPEAGLVLVDGIPIREFDIDFLRNHIRLVVQEAYLFSGTIHDNISACCPYAPAKDVILAARAACADEFIEQLPNGYNTQTGDRGANLSGGQIQRLALARAILSRPKVLILDESTSAVDFETEQKIYRNLREFLPDTTLIAITHRIPALQDASIIVVVERGSVEAVGEHASLSQTSDVYRRLSTLQRVAA